MAARRPAYLPAAAAAVAAAAADAAAGLDAVAGPGCNAHERLWLTPPVCLPIYCKARVCRAAALRHQVLTNESPACII